MKTTLINKAIKTIATTILLASGLAQATILQLAPINYLTTTTYNDFQIQSLYLNDACATANDARCKPSGPYPVQSGPGQIDDQAIILTGSNSQQMNNITSPFPAGSSVDNPYLTPTGMQGNSFQMIGQESDDNNFTGDLSNSWEVSISQLLGYLNGNALIFLFDNNQEGATTSQDLYVWGQVRITDAAGAIQDCVEFSTASAGSGCGNVPPAAADFVWVPGTYCVSTVDGSAYNVGTASNAGDCNAGDYFVNDNLGTDSAEFVVFSTYLNDNLQTWASNGWFLSVEVRYYNNTDGSEQMWICSACNLVPEPSSLALLALALLSLAASRHQARVRK